MIERGVQSLAEALAADLSARYSKDIDPSAIVEMAPAGHTLPDSTRKFLCPAADDPTSLGGFLLLSAEGNPRLVARAAANIVEIRRRLPEGLRPPVLAPEAGGEVCGLSYAVWPRRRPLSKQRLILAIQKRVLAPSLFDWLFAVSRVSATQPEDADKVNLGFAVPLQSLTADARQPAAIREAAAKCLQRLADGLWTPRHCIQHSDFWIGNVLLGRGNSRPGAFRFHVIDWAGASLFGYPFIDLARLSMSVNAPATRRAAEFKRHCVAFGCDGEDAVGYVLCALGALGANLEHFPEENYVDLCRRTVDYAQQSILQGA